MKIIVDAAGGVVRALKVRTNLSRRRFPTRPIVFRHTFIQYTFQNQGTHLLFHTHYHSQLTLFTPTRGL